MKFPNIKKILQKALGVIPLILAIWKLFESKKDEEDEK
jgi:cadmium resistance protein CadD (predicted permease)